jgi:triosephosphate isomerase
MHAHIRGLVPAGMKILYGGSVKSSNAAEILSTPNVDGALVGGASLKADEFWAIATAV